MNSYNKIIDLDSDNLIKNIFKDIYKCSSKKSYIGNKKITSSLCCICLEKLDFNEKRNFNCGHYFHRECSDRWFEKSLSLKCPYCRQCIFKKK